MLGQNVGQNAAPREPDRATPDVSPAPRDQEMARLPVDLLQRGKYQPRIDMHQETLQELADSIKVQGVIQPIVVRPLSDGPAGQPLRYEIIAGERRWRAAQLAGLHEIPAVIRRIPDEAAIAMSLIENIQRENLNPLEEARALDRLIREFDMTHQTAAEAVGRSRASVSNLLRLLELADEVKALVRRMEKTEQPAAPPPGTDPDIKRLENDLADKLGAKVQLQHSSKGSGKLVISYHNLDELDGILAHMQ